MSARKYICPACRQMTGVKILYGMPTDEAFAMAKRHEIVLGRCCIDVESPELKCTSCGHEWRFRRGEGEV